MKPLTLTRREALFRAGLALGSAVTLPPTRAGAASTPSTASPKLPFRYCLNTATIRGHKLGLLKEVEVAAQAGYQGIEPWVGSIEDYRNSGASLDDLRKRIVDLGLTVESAIGFPEWIVDDDARRAKGLERAKYEMDLIAKIGGKRVAAPPAGATNNPGLDLRKAAQRYRTLLEAGHSIGVVPMVELWGFSQNLRRLGEVAFVAIESGHPAACIVADVFHIYKGGSDFRGLKLIAGTAMPVFHLNDYPAEPTRDQINDSYRVFPGDGVAPLREILQDLNATGGQKVLSLELFNRKYYEQDPLTVAKTGLEKMKMAVQNALG